MNFIKLIPILFLAYSPAGDARPTGQHVLPAIPGYIPVYIQTGSQPPNLEQLYLGPESKSAEEPVHPKREIPPQITVDPVKGEGQGDKPSEDGQKKADVPKKIEEIKTEEDKKDTKEVAPIKKIEESPVRLDTKEKVKPVGQIREVPQYEVKEPQQE